MWSAVVKFLGIPDDSEEDDDDSFEHLKSRQLENAEIDAACHELHEELEEKEFDGVVTSLHSAYGLINNEIFFTEENVCDGDMPKVGDQVHVVTWRKGSAGGWRAKRVFMNLVNTDFAVASADTCISKVDSTENEICRSVCSNALKDSKHAANQIKQELLKEKLGIRISAQLDFGQLLLGDSASLLIKIMLVPLNVNSVSVTCCQSFEYPVVLFSYILV
jgi:hypothetical protein